MQARATSTVQARETYLDTARVDHDMSYLSSAPHRRNRRSHSAESRGADNLHETTCVRGRLPRSSDMHSHQLRPCFQDGRGWRWRARKSSPGGTTTAAAHGCSKASAAFVDGEEASTEGAGSHGSNTEIAGLRTPSIWAMLREDGGSLVGEGGDAGVSPDIRRVAWAAFGNVTTHFEAQKVHSTGLRSVANGVPLGFVVGNSSTSGPAQAPEAL